MKVITELEQLKIPNVVLPKGYEIVRSDFSIGDKYLWSKLQMRTRNPKMFPRGEFDMVFFAKYYNDYVGAVSVLIDSIKTGYFHSAIVLPEHRRKGLYKALMKLCLEYCREIKVENLRFAVDQPFLEKFWRDLGV